MFDIRDAGRGRNPAAAIDQATFKLRVLATTDLHMQMVGYDYVNNTKLPFHGLAGVGAMIAEARAEARAEGRSCLLLDNGDVLQGSPMGDLIAQQDVTPAHPVIAAFNHLRYDAVGLGNHDLDFGLGYLRQIAGALEMPMICSNMDGNDLSPLSKAAVLTCRAPAAVGEGDTTLKVGILSLLPDLTSAWNRHNLNHRVAVAPALPRLESAVAEVRAQGADIVILLAHMGIGTDGHPGSGVLGLAHLDGVDAIIAGHTHRRFPGLDHTGRKSVDSETGTLKGRPAAMPGHGGSDLAVLDLTLRRGIDQKWNVANHYSVLRPNVRACPDPAIVAACTPSHDATLAHLSEEVGHTARPLHTFFSFAMPTRPAEILARAKALVVRDALEGTVFAELPLIAAASAHTAGGRAGASHYLDIPAGPLQRRHVAGLCPYVNEIWALRISGEELRDLLEHAVRGMNTLATGHEDQFLIEPAIPGFNFDTIFGVTYQIDPRSKTNRILDLCHRGQPVRDTQEFVLATNQFRAAGGGGFSSNYGRVLHRSKVPMEEALIAALRPDQTLHWPDQPFSFAAGPTVRALLDTAPGARAHLAEIAHLAPEQLGLTPQGFLRLRLTL